MGMADLALALGQNGRLRLSDLPRATKLGIGAPAEFWKWAYGGGVKLPGLVTRREAERELFMAA
jgi:GH24 family phage-related lysozyme (muramidase)